MSISKKVVIIDYGSGNLQSVFNALKQVQDSSTQILISNNPDDLKSATHIILPGVGAFKDCIDGLNAIPNMVEELKIQVLENKKPFLGICVGMQLLADVGFEHGKSAGLGFIAGQVEELKNPNGDLKIPHTGWNEITIKKDHAILKDIKAGEHFYFVHSYHFVVKNQEDVIASVEYGQNINAIIAKENIVATQFHPEKSADAGLKILRNFINS